MKRYRVSYANGVIEEDGSPRRATDSQPMYMCADVDAELLALRTQRAADVTALNLKDAELASLRAELGEARKDAQRYRWLRDFSSMHYDGMPATLVMRRDESGDYWDGAIQGEQLDAAIDAQLATPPEKAGG